MTVCNNCGAQQPRLQLRYPHYIDLRPFLPTGWEKELEGVLHEQASQVKQSEGGAGSLGYKEAAGIDYAYLMAPELVAALPWAEYLHRELLPVLLNLQGYGGLAGDPRADGTIIPILEPHGITANLYRGDRKGIEWHRDGADVWLNVLMTTKSFFASSGGCLMVHDGENVLTFEFPTPGIGLVALVGDFPHIASQLTNPEAERAVLMFSYTNPERQNWREAAYEEHFYPEKPGSPEQPAGSLTKD